MPDDAPATPSPLAPGDRYELSFTLDADDIAAFAEVTGDRNPVHLADEAGRAAGFEGRLAHGMLTASVFSKILGMTFPGPGTIYLGQTLRFLAPVYPGTPLVAAVEVVGRERRRVRLRTTVTTGDGTLALDGEAEVLLPRGS